MKISRLVSILEGIMDQNGDLRVKVSLFDYGSAEPASKTEVISSNITGHLIGTTGENDILLLFGEVNPEEGELIN